jgi:hypothetical protein
MATVDAATRKPYLPPVTQEELKARNAEAMRLLDEWVNDVSDAADQAETMAILRKALGPERTISDRSAFKP